MKRNDLARRGRPARRSLLADRRGLTLVELLIAMLITGLVASVAMAFVTQQEQAFTFGTGRMATLQNYRFALNTLERNLRTMGAQPQVPIAQPVLIYAGTDVIAFNADYASNQVDDPFAVYVDPTAPNAAVTALTRTQRMQIPRTDMMYPDTTYLVDGFNNSPAETIVFYFAVDSTTTQPNRFVLYRQVNREPPEVVARNLMRRGSLPFFEYQKLTVPASGAATLETVPAARIPLRHRARIHGSAADTGADAMIDSIHAVRVNLVAVTGRSGAREQRREVSRTIRLPNAGIDPRISCGEPPILGVSLSAKYDKKTRAIHLTWKPAVDEYQGEQDVLRYLIWRRVHPQTAWDVPFTSIAAGASSYTVMDADLQPDKRYTYALAAQDCSPALSALAVSAQVKTPDDDDDDDD